MVYLLGRVHGRGLGMRISGIADGVITDRQIAGSWLWIEDSRTGEAQQQFSYGHLDICKTRHRCTQATTASTL